MAEKNGFEQGGGTAAVATLSPANENIAVFIKLQGQDLNEQQMFVPVNSLLAPGTRVKVEYRVQSFGQKTNVKIIDAIAEVTGSSIDKPRGRHGVIVRFMKLSPNSLTLIRKILEKKRSVQRSQSGIRKAAQEGYQSQPPAPSSSKPPHQAPEAPPAGIFGESTTVMPVAKLAELAKEGEVVHGVPPPVPELPSFRSMAPPKEKVIEPLKFFRTEEEPGEPARDLADEEEPDVDVHVDEPAAPVFETTSAVEKAVEEARPVSGVNMALLAAVEEASGGTEEEPAAPLVDNLPAGFLAPRETYSQTPVSQVEPAAVPKHEDYTAGDSRKILEIVKKKKGKRPRIDTNLKVTGVTRKALAAALVLLIVGMWAYTIKANFYPTLPPYVLEIAAKQAELKRQVALQDEQKKLHQKLQNPDIKITKNTPEPPKAPQKRGPQTSHAFGPGFAAQSKQNAQQKPEANALITETREPPRKKRPEPREEQAEPDFYDVPNEPPKTSPGSLIISSAPLGDIYFDGQMMGRPPVEIKSTPPGKHRIEVRKDGYKPEERIVIVKPGSREAVFIKLTPAVK